jgi:metal-responsive CopG/Arc/MetJ family transcriptional regulator
MTQEIVVSLPDDLADELSDLSGDRVDEVVAEGVREALDLSRSAEERRDELHARRRGDAQSTEELADDDESGLSAAERKRRELREKMGPR